MVDQNRIGIIGAGTMGSALAQKFAQENFEVVLLDREEKFLQKGLTGITATLDEAVERRIFDARRRDAVLQNIRTSTDLQQLSNCALIIEAVFEDKSVKQALFTELCRVVPQETILATNTSSFSVTELATSVTRPERFIGLHFFYHAAKNRLVEVVRGSKTGDEVFDQAMRLMQRSGKDPITCRDAHGFVVNRFFVPWLNEAVRMLEEGIADMATIDAVACKTFACGMGPFALMNATGVPIAYHAQNTLFDAYGEFYRPADSLRRQAELNEPWPLEKDDAIAEDKAETIADRLTGVIFLVCGQLLDEQVCTAGDINRGARIGLRWRKGPLELYQCYGERKTRKLVSGISGRWQLPEPQSLTSAAWQPDFIKIDRKNRTGIIAINRPEDLNALSPLLVSQLQQAFDQLDKEPDIETIIFTGQGKAFVAGADIKFFIDHIRKNTIPEITSFTTTGQQLFERIDASAKTIVAVINGLALGGGLELALTADHIVALPNALMAFPETGIGIYPGLGGTQRTVKRVGKGLAKFLIYTGSMIPANTAREMGLIDKTIDWNEMQDIMSGQYSFEPVPSDLADRWRQTAEFFERYSVDDFLAPETELQQELKSEAWQKTIKKIRQKAPRALRIAEKLINDQQGPSSELAYLEEIFSTEDALAGLQSVGRKPPQYSGR